MKIAIIRWGNIGIDGLLHDFWNPPERVLEFWNTGCKIEYRGEEDYLEQEELIIMSVVRHINWETNKKRA